MGREDEIGYQAYVIELREEIEDLKEDVSALMSALTENINACVKLESFLRKLHKSTPHAWLKKEIEELLDL